MDQNESSNYNWDIAILTFVILILLFFWIYKFLFIANPRQLSNQVSLTTSTVETETF
jgi:uncharacterized membrane protein (DUF106 family)